jgi:hypothetical protein
MIEKLSTNIYIPFRFNFVPKDENFGISDATSFPADLEFYMELKYR